MPLSGAKSGGAFAAEVGKYVHHALAQAMSDNAVKLRMFLRIAILPGPPVQDISPGGWPFQHIACTVATAGRGRLQKDRHTADKENLSNPSRNELDELLCRQENYENFDGIHPDFEHGDRHEGHV